MTMVFPATRPRDEAGSRLKVALGGIEHGETSSCQPTHISRHCPRGDSELAHGGPQHHEQKEVDQRYECDAECRVEPAAGNQLIDRGLDHPAATVYRILPNATSSPAAIVAAFKRTPLTQVPLVLPRSI